MKDRDPNVLNWWQKLLMGVIPLIFLLSGCALTRRAVSLIDTNTGGVFQQPDPAPSERTNNGPGDPKEKPEGGRTVRGSVDLGPKGELILPFPLDE